MQKVKNIEIEKELFICQNYKTYTKEEMAKKLELDINHITDAYKTYQDVDDMFYAFQQKLLGLWDWEDMANYREQTIDQVKHDYYFCLWMCMENEELTYNNKQLLEQVIKLGNL